MPNRLPSDVRRTSVGRPSDARQTSVARLSYVMSNVQLASIVERPLDVHRTSTSGRPKPSHLEILFVLDLRFHLHHQAHRVDLKYRRVKFRVSTMICVPNPYPRDLSRADTRWTSVHVRGRESTMADDRRRSSTIVEVRLRSSTIIDDPPRRLRTTLDDRPRSSTTTIVDDCDFTISSQHNLLTRRVLNRTHSGQTNFTSLL